MPPSPLWYRRESRGEQEGREGDPEPPAGGEEGRRGEREAGARWSGGKETELLTKSPNATTWEVTRRMGQTLRVKASERAAADAIMEQELRHLFLTTVQVGECDPFHLSIPN